MPEDEGIPGCLTFSSDNSFTLTINSKTTYEGSLQYSTDTITWADVIKGTAISSVNNKIYLRGSGNSCFGQSGGTSLISKILLTGSNVKCDGNIETLLDYQTVLKGEHPTMANECFEGMFQSCTSLITAPSLPATKLSDLCYRAMFNKCSNLTTAPALPATILTKQCYEYMFQSCTSLTQLPALRATDLKSSCYYYMFYKCSKIKLSTTKTGEYVNEYRIPYGTNIGTRASNCEISMFESTGGQTIYATINGYSYKGTPTINTTYYTSNEIVYGLTIQVDDSETDHIQILSDIPTSITTNQTIRLRVRALGSRTAVSYSNIGQTSVTREFISSAEDGSYNDYDLIISNPTGFDIIQITHSSLVNPTPW